MAGRLQADEAGVVGETGDVVVYNGRHGGPILSDQYALAIAADDDDAAAVVEHCFNCSS